MRKAYYMGKRLEKGMPRHTMTDDLTVWCYPKAKDISFSGAVIGYAYLIPDLGLPPVFPNAELTEEATHKHAAQWQAEHREAIEVKKASKVDPAPIIQAHVNGLVQACRGMTVAQKSRFLSYLIQQFMRA